MRHIKKFEASRINHAAEKHNKFNKDVIDFLDSCFVEIQEIKNKYQTSFFNINTNKYGMVIYTPSIAGSKDVDFNQLQLNIDIIKKTFDLVDECLDKVRTRYSISYEFYLSSNNCYRIDITLDQKHSLEPKNMIDDDDWSDYTG